MNNKNETVMRYQVADYLNVGTGEIADYVLMGTGFDSLDENPSAQNESKHYISDISASNYIKGYQTQFPFTADLIKSEKALMALYDVGRNHKTGADAEFDYVRAELFRPVTGKDNTFEARLFRVSVEISGNTGAGGEAVQLAGNLNAVGDFIDGEFNTTTRTFTPKGSTESQANAYSLGKDA